jgi:hypothetical protein
MLVDVGAIRMGTIEWANRELPKLDAWCRADPSATELAAAREAISKSQVKGPVRYPVAFALSVVERLRQSAADATITEAVEVEPVAAALSEAHDALLGPLNQRLWNHFDGPFLSKLGKPSFVALVGANPPDPDDEDALDAIAEAVRAKFPAQRISEGEDDPTPSGELQSARSLVGALRNYIPDEEVDLFGLPKRDEPAVGNEGVQ